MPKPTDKELLALLKEKPEKGFSQLIDAYQERLYWLIRRNVFVHEDANDILQEVFVKIWKNISRFRGDSNLYTWLYRITINEVFTFQKKEAKRKSLSMDSDEMEYFKTSLKNDDYFDGDKAEILLQQAIKNLPEKQRMVFTMRYYNETPYADMSKALETSIGALKASYHHAVKKIEEFVKQH